MGYNFCTVAGETHRHGWYGNRGTTMSAAEHSGRDWLWLLGQNLVRNFHHPGALAGRVRDDA